MLINNKVTVSRVKFVSYTGEWPNLCRGVLTLEIDGKEYKFGHDYTLPHSYDENGNWIWGDKDNFESFWASGGSVGFSDDWSESYVNDGEWEIIVEDLPEQFWDVADEIDRVINENVPQGCCGGCL